MPTVVSILLKWLPPALLQELILTGLEKVAARSTNTVDDQVVAVVRHALDGRLNPIRRVVGK